MSTDVGEQKNLYLEKPEVAKRLLALLEADVNRGRSTEGADSKNDVDKIVLWKSGEALTPEKRRGGRKKTGDRTGSR